MRAQRVRAGDVRRPTHDAVSSWSQATAATFAVDHDIARAYQVAVVGLDDIELADLLDPPANVVRRDPTAIGCIAAEIIFAEQAGCQHHNKWSSQQS